MVSYVAIETENTHEANHAERAWLFGLSDGRRFSGSAKNIGL